jgi:hypothetical protein
MNAHAKKDNKKRIMTARKKNTFSLGLCENLGILSLLSAQ